MTKAQALTIIDYQKDGAREPMELLNWTWLRVIINQIPNEDWERYVEAAAEVLAK